MKRRSRLLLLVGIILAVVAGLLAFTMLRKPAPVPEQPVTTRKVAVASQDIAMGKTIDPLAVELRDWPADTAPADAVINLADLSGKYAKTAIFSGQVVQAKMVADRKELAETGELGSILVPPGMVAYPFPISELSGVSYALRTGDRVDVLITFHFLDVDKDTQVSLPLKRNISGDIEGKQIPRLVSQLTLQNIEVLRVGSWYIPPTTVETQTTTKEGEPAPTPPPPAVITLLVSQQDALVLQFAKEAQALVEFALRNPNDAEPASAESVTLDYILARFNITVPVKREESLESLQPK